MIDNYLRGESQQEDHVIHLLFSANRWELAYALRLLYSPLAFLIIYSATIKAEIAAGTTVIVDRYYYSGCVYSTAKGNPDMDLAWCRHPDEGLPRPDICLFLDLSAAEAAKRGGWGEERYEKKEFQDRVRKLFGTMRESADKDDFVVIDAGKSEEEVADSIKSEVEKVAASLAASKKPLGRVQPW